jgi:hypothetical protein
VAHLLFCQLTKPNKKSKRATKPTHQDSSKMDRQQHDRKEGQHLTAVTVAQLSKYSYKIILLRKKRYLKLI